MALIRGGTWLIRPTNVPSAERSVCSVIAAASSAAPSAGGRPSPSASSVTVDWPSLIVPAYSLSVSARCPSSLVAFSTPITRTPVAIGSRVPAWPTRRVPVSRLIRATTSCEVIPPDLSTMTNPDSIIKPPPCPIRGSGPVAVPRGPRDRCRPASRPLVLRLVVAPVGIRVSRVHGAGPDRGQPSIGLPSLDHEILDGPGTLGQHVLLEGDGRGVLDAGLPADLGADHAGRAGQRSRRCRLLLGRPVHRIEHCRVAQVTGHAGVGDRNEAEPRVLDSPLEHFGDDLSDPLAEPSRPRRIHRYSLPFVIEQPLPGRQQLDAGTG